MFIRFLRRLRRARLVSGLRRRSGIRASDVLFYDELLRCMAAAGLAKPDTMPPLLWSRTVAGSAAVSELVEQLVEQFYRVRYAHEPLSADAKQRVRDQLQQLKQILGSSQS